MKELHESVGAFQADNLILDPTYPAQIGAGVFEDVVEPILIKRGQLLAKVNGKLAKATTEQKEGLSISLSETIVESGTVVEVLLAGAINANGIIVGEGEDAYDYKDELRSNNIYIKNTIGGI